MKTQRRRDAEKKAEKPILFSGAMVLAILEGRKTQTRRILKPQPTKLAGPNFDGLWSDTIDPVVRYFACPHGAPGDRLWVREAWRPIGHLSECTSPEDIRYAASADDAEWATARWRPSIHMPRWASRITLEIVGIRVERLQEISEADAKAEGPAILQAHGMILDAPYRDGFRVLWNSLNEERGCGWDVNPWVWVVEFKRVEK